MKIRKSRFKYLMKHYHNHKLYSIGKDSYLAIRPFKYILRNLVEVLKYTVALPWGLICCIANFITEIPYWVKEFWRDLKECCPIAYIKVVDDEEIQVIE